MKTQSSTIESSQNIDKQLSTLINTSSTGRNVYTQLLLCEFDKVEKDSYNPMYKKGNKPNYASLPSIYKAIQPTLRKHGLVDTAYVSEEKDDIMVVRVTHPESMTYIHTSIKLINMTDMQKSASARTYARKALAELVGVPICEEESDDDGNATLYNNPVKAAFSKASPINVTPQTKVIEQPKLSESEQNKIGLITYELDLLWKKKEGSIRADGSPESKVVIQRFESNLEGLSYERLVKLKDFITKGNFVDVIIPQRLPTNETNIIH